MPRGQKTCPTCKAGCGPRTKTCPCGYVFIKAVPSGPPTTPTTDAQISTPIKAELPKEALPIESSASYDPPVRPKSMHIEDVKTWCVEMAKARRGGKGPVYYTENAILEFLRPMYPNRVVPSIILEFLKS